MRVFLVLLRATNVQRHRLDVFVLRRRIEVKQVPKVKESSLLNTFKINVHKIRTEGFRQLDTSARRFPPGLII